MGGPLGLDFVCWSPYKGGDPVLVGQACLWSLLQVLFQVPFPEQHHELKSKRFRVLG